MPFGIAVSTACWLFGAGPGLYVDLDTSSVHWPGMTPGVCAARSAEPARANVSARSVCFMPTIIASRGRVSI